MAGNHQPEVQIRVNSKRGGNVIHPLNVGSPEDQERNEIEYREIKQFKKWVPWLIPAFVVANIVMFIVTMYVNDCPKNSVSCVADSLGRFAFQPFKENPLLGPSATT